MKKIIVFTLLFTIGVGIVVLYQLLTNAPSGSDPTLKTLQIPTYYPSQGIDYTFKNEDVDLPERLPSIIVTVRNFLHEEEVIQLAKDIGFTNPHTKSINANKQRLYFFSSNDAFMTVYADEGKISFRSYKPLENVNKQLSDDEIVSIAKSFVAQTFNFSETDLHLSFISHKENDESTNEGYSQDQPQGYFIVNFSPVATSYKVVTKHPEESPITVIVADGGTVGKVDLKLVSEANLSETQYRIKTFDDIKNEIDKAVITHINNEYYGEEIRPGQIDKVEINKIEIAYFAEGNAARTSYQPIFLMEGLGIFDSERDPLNVTLYLPALKSP